MNPCLIHGCHRCCLDTEMLLSKADVERIESLGFRDFYREKDGFLLLKNIGGKCFFLGVDGRCMIYHDRPEGCRFYPFVFHTEKGVSRDADCPYSNEFQEPEHEKLRALVEKIMEERDDRLGRIE